MNLDIVPIGKPSLNNKIAQRRDDQGGGLLAASSLRLDYQPGCVFIFATLIVSKTIGFFKVVSKAFLTLRRKIGDWLSIQFFDPKFILMVEKIIFEVKMILLGYF
ncbi:hypothetical protein [Clostridium facile]|uniref:Uncharacterized protein n=1 Tax=Clostridium facile TaxID=2763035 RepID=A0ABR7INZ1_9CLOT|nr:hypothetical protein [Clostridium facile]MBC5786831.1 hypothetical protein [Clostridium facile]